MQSRAASRGSTSSGAGPAGHGRTTSGVTGPPWLPGGREEIESQLPNDPARQALTEVRVMAPIRLSSLGLALAGTPHL